MDFGEVVGWTVMRDKLDYLILQEATRAGARLLEGPRLRGVEILATLLYRFPRLCYHFFVRSPSIQRGVANVLQGRSSFQILCRDILKDGPRLLVAGLR